MFAIVYSRYLSLVPMLVSMYSMYTATKSGPPGLALETVDIQKVLVKNLAQHA